MALKTKKQVYDNVHGFIGLTDIELQIVDSPLFQRLRNVMQLGPASFVYPGATHTRFEHCLGTMFMMDQFIANVRSYGEPITEDDDTIQMMRIAALLHDIGHYPMSHSLEHIAEKTFGGKSHVEFGGELIRRFYADTLSSYRLEEIINLISGKSRSQLGMLLSSAFDADKSDYLLRDSYHTGVGYGKVSLQRLMMTASFDKNRIIFDKDEEVVESFLLGRYHMYRSVYHHKTVVAFIVLIGRIFERLVKEGAIANPKDITKRLDETQIMQYDDHMLYSSMREYLRKGKDATLKEQIRMFLLRKPLSAAFINSVIEKGNTDESQVNLMIKKMQYDDKAMGKFAAEAGIDAEWIFPSYMRSLGLIDDKTPIYVNDKHGVKSVLENHGLIMHLVGKERLYDARIYVHPRYKAKLAAYMKRYE